LLLQLAAIALAAWRVPLAAQFPQPAEFEAVRILITAQFVGAALLCPVLFRSWQMALASVCSAVVFMLLAPVLAGWPLQAALPTIGYLTSWLACLVIWTIRSGGKWRLAVGAVSATYAAGGPLIWYLEMDFGRTSVADSSFAYGPLLATLLHPQSPWTNWWLMPVVFWSGFVVAIIRFQLSRRTRHSC
jgi:hypothetical protein